MSERPIEAPRAATAAGEWVLVARNSRVLKGWQELAERAPENMRECFGRLCSKPLERLPGRIFPLKHKKYKGAWEYEVTSGDRVFYIPDSATKRVVVYYAGKHVTPVPFPPAL
jgi:hypothetical protein